MLRGIAALLLTLLLIPLAAGCGGDEKARNAASAKKGKENTNLQVPAPLPPPPPIK